MHRVHIIGMRALDSWRSICRPANEWSSLGTSGLGRREARGECNAACALPLEVRDREVVVDTGIASTARASSEEC
ncbi:hypothetical protein Micbo1qcDRAFT_165268, partial [Microdochium bolleyi]